MAELSKIPSVRLGSTGVMFNYLFLELESEGTEKELIRGLNFIPFAGSPEERVLQWLNEELEAEGLEQSSRRVHVRGGGSLSLNPYDETITLFGASSTYGAEPDREAVADLLETEFKGYKVGWYEPEQTSRFGASNPNDSK